MAKSSREITFGDPFEFRPSGRIIVPRADEGRIEAQLRVVAKNLLPGVKNTDVAGKLQALLEEGIRPMRPSGVGVNMFQAKRT